jgi:hypothetical protein
MLLTKEVSVKWCGTNRSYYESRGYIFTKMYEPFIVSIEDLTEGSSATVSYQCDKCKTVKPTMYSAYVKRRKNNPDYVSDLCGSCSTKNKPKNSPKNKLSIEIVRKEFEDRGYTLISEEYVRSNDKLLYTCPKHEHKGHLSITRSSLKSGHGCKYCGEEGSRSYSAYIYRNVKRINSHLTDALWKDIKRSGNIYSGIYNMDEIIAEAFKSLDMKKKDIVFEYTKNELQLLEEKVLELFREKHLLEEKDLIKFSNKELLKKKS